MSLSRFTALLILLSLLLAHGCGLGGIAKERASAHPEADVKITQDISGAVRFDAKRDGPESIFRVAFDPPVDAAKKERLVLDGRAITSKREGLVIARIRLYGRTPEQALVHEPDIRFGEFWSLREIPLDELDGDRKILEGVSRIELVAWMPDEIGKSYTFLLRQCDFQTLDDVRASLRISGLRRAGSIPPRPSPTENRKWRSFGPGGGGWLRCLAISPHDGAFFAGCDVGGIYRSADRGKSWQIVNDGLTNTYCQTLLFHPKDKNVVYAGMRGGVAKSTDGGATWQMKRHGFPPLRTFGLSAPISALAIDPDRPNIVYAGVGIEREFGKLLPGTEGGRIYKSTDDGDHWREIKLPDAKDQSVTCLTLKPGEAKTLYAVTPKALYRSTDSGETWATHGKIADGHSLTLAVVKHDDPKTMLFGYSSSKAGRGGVLKSTDGGLTWRDCSNGLSKQPGLWMLIAHPSDPAVYFAASHTGGGIYVTNSTGEQWRPLNTGQNVSSAWFFTGLNATGLCADPRDGKTLLYCNDMDIYLTADGGASWRQIAADLVRPATENHPDVWRGRGIETTCASDLAIDPRDPRTIYFSYWDTNLWKSTDGGRTCYWLTDGLDFSYGRVGCILLDPEYPDVVWVSKGHNYDHQRIYKSINAGERFRLTGYPATGMPPGAVFSMAIDPTSPPESRTLCAAVNGYGVYKSTDGGFRWQEASQGLPPKSRRVLRLAMDPRNPKQLFIAARSHHHADTKEHFPGYVARTLDGGEHWDVVLRDLEATTVLIDPFDSNTIYAGNRDFSGYSRGNALFKSTDGGTTWIPIKIDAFPKPAGQPLGDQGDRIYLFCLAADPSRRGVLYASCIGENYDLNRGRGVLVSEDHGETWRSLTLSGLGSYGASVLVVDPVDPSRLYAGTGGDGFFCLER